MFTNLAILGGKTPLSIPQLAPKDREPPNRRLKNSKIRPSTWCRWDPRAPRNSKWPCRWGQCNFSSADHWTRSQLTLEICSFTDPKIVFVCYQVDLSYVLHLEVKHTCGWCKANCVVKRCQKQGMVGWNPMLIDINVRCSLDFMVKSQQKISHVVVFEISCWISQLDTPW